MVQDVFLLSVTLRLLICRMAVVQSPGPHPQKPEEGEAAAFGVSVLLRLALLLSRLWAGWVLRGGGGASRKSGLKGEKTDE